MSKLLTGLMEAERKRRALAADDRASPADAAASENSASGPATLAGMSGGGDDGATQAVRNRVEQGFAAAQAAAARLEAERAVVASLEERIGEEAAALARAQREERRAAELAAVASARAAKDSELARLSEERGAAERCAADRAAALLASERAAEAALAARVAAEEIALRETRRRIELEAEASRAAAERLRLERAIRAAPGANRETNGGLAELAPDPAMGPDPGDPVGNSIRSGNDPQSRSIPSGRRRLVAVAMTIAIAGSAGYWLGRQAKPVVRPAIAAISPVTAVSATSPTFDEDPPSLRLDHGLRAAPIPAPVSGGKP